MVVTTNNASTGSSKSNDFKRDRPPLKELLAKKYPFLNSDLSGMLDDLLEKDIIQLPEPKRPDEVGMINNPKYCLYHRMVSHSIEDCITLKELIMKLVSNGRILLDNDETAEANHATITTSSDPLHKSHDRLGQMIQFGNLPPVQVCVHKPTVYPEPTIYNQRALLKSNQDASDNEGWIIATPKKSRKHLQLQSKTIHNKSKHWGKKPSNHLKGKCHQKSHLSSVDQSKIIHCKGKHWGKKPSNHAKEKKNQPSVYHSKHHIRPSITLKDFFPKGYFTKVTVNAMLVAKIRHGQEVAGNEVFTTKTSPQTSQDDAKASNAQALPSKKIDFAHNGAGAVTPGEGKK